MANHASHALPWPVKNARYTVAVPYLDADGDPLDPTTPDTEISKDGGSYADCAEEVTTIAGSNGSGFITLSGAETDCSFFFLAAKAASGPKSTLLTDKPRVLPLLFSGTASAGAAGTLTLATDIPAVADLLVGCVLKTTGGTGGGGTGGANNQARVITDFTTGRVASVVPNWETTPDGTTTYEVLRTEMSIISYADIKLWGGSAPNALISGRPDVNAQVVGDKTGYALTQAFPANFSALVIDGTGIVDSNVEEWNANAVPAEHTAGYPVVTVKDGAGTGEINTNAGKVVGVELVDALTTYTGNTPQSGDAYSVVNSGTHGNAALKTLIDTVDNFVDSEVSAIQAIVNKLDTALESDGPVYRFTLNSLELAPTGGSAPTALAIADAVWDEALAPHLSAGSTGEKLNAAGAAGDPWSTTLPASYTTNQAGFILGTNLNATVGSRSTQTSVDIIDDFLDTEAAAILASVDTEVGAIKTKTDQLTFGVTNVLNINATHWKGTALPAEHTLGYPVVTVKDGAGAGEINTNAGKVVGVELVDTITTYTGNTLQTGDSFLVVNSGTHGNAALKVLIDTIDNFVDTEVAQILGAVDTEIASLLTIANKLDTALEVDGAVYRFTLNSLELAPTGGSAPTAATIAAAVWNSIMADFLAAGSTGNKLNAAASAGDPWNTTLPATYPVNTAGHIIGSAIKSKVDQLTFSTVNRLDANSQIVAGGIPANAFAIGAIDDNAFAIAAANKIRDAILNASRGAFSTPTTIGEAIGATLDSSHGLTVLENLVDDVEAGITALQNTVNLLTTAQAQPGTGAPPAAIAPYLAVLYMYKFMRNLHRTNKITGLLEFLNDAGTTVEQKVQITDINDVTTFGKIVQGP